MNTEEQTLPALVVQVEGRVISTNLVEFAASGRSMIAQINTDPQTDEELEVAAKVVKRCKESEELIDTVTAQALGQMVSVDELVKTMAALKGEFAKTRLGLSKKVEANKITIKTQIVDEGRIAIGKHVAGLNEELGGEFLSVVNPGRFDAAIKGLSSFASMREKVASTLATAKVDHDEIAAVIRKNQKAMAGIEHLFPDFSAVCTKAADDFSAQVAKRKQEDEKRQEEAREKIRQEESDRLTREAAQKDAQEKAQANQEERDNDQRGKTEEATHAQPKATAAPQAPSASTPPIQAGPGLPEFSPVLMRDLVRIMSDALKEVRGMVKPDGKARAVIDEALRRAGIEGDLCSPQ